jgi:molecular chaperone DnaK
VASPLSEYFQKPGLRVLEASLQKIVGKPASYVEQEDQYRQTVTLPSWESLAPPIRLLLRRRFKEWLEMFEAMREQLFDLGSGKVALRPDSTRILRRLLDGFCPPDKDDKGTEEVQSPCHPVTLSPCHLPAKPETPSRAVGIDLGTTYSLIAYVDAQGRPTCIANSNGDLLTPSVVLFDEGGAIVGKEAVQASPTDPDKVAECVKRDMGAKVYRKPINGEYLPPEVISSMILRSLKSDAERKFGHPVSRAVITVPAYFEETRRRATMDAGRLAGLQVLDIINEPTAAAIAYGYQLGFLSSFRTPRGPGQPLPSARVLPEQNSGSGASGLAAACSDRHGGAPTETPLRVVVFDLGGGTFDVTIVQIQGTDFKALATDGDVQLGGKDWDERLIDLAAERFRHEFREDPRENPVSLQELWLSAESAKRTLSERKKAMMFVNHLGSRLKVEVTREEFEEATAGLMERTRMTTEIVVRQAGLSWSEIDRVLLVGGSTRMPMIRRMLRELSGKEPESSISADEAVAQGAALYAELLAPREGGAAEDEARFTVVNVNSHSLGVLGADPETGRKLNKILIPKNSPLPHTVTKGFKTFRANQRSVVVNVLEGESDKPDLCTSIGVCTIRDLPPDLPAGWPVRVSYTYESNGRLHVTAQLKGYDAAVTADFERENRLPDEDLDLWTQYAAEEMSKPEE